MIDYERIKEHLLPCSNHGCIIQPERKGIGTNGPCHCSRDRIKMEKLVLLLRHDNEVLRQQLAQQPSDDTKRLNSGMIQIQTRDSFGEYQETHMRGLNLREAIDKAMNEAKPKDVK